MIRFLSQVWPETGNYLVAYPLPENDKGETLYAQSAFSDIESAYKEALKFSAKGKNAYFAVGSVDNVGRPAKRKNANIVQFRSFIVDIDCGEDKFAEGKGYLTQPDAVEALKTFITKLNLPKPILVNSGYGYHVYWTLTESISAADWKPIAFRFKQVLKHFGIIADPTRTSDISSILRVPDTINYKRGAQVPVKVEKWGQPSELSEFVEPLEKYANENNLEVFVERYKPDDEMSAMLKEFGINSNLDKEFEPADFEMILGKCATIKHCVEHNELLSEPLWRGALSIAKFCENGDELIHRVSECHPDYSVNATEAKAEAITAPFTCAYFKDNCKACEGCIEGCNSPISLGRVIQFVSNSSEVPTSLVMPAGNSNMTIEIADEPEVSESIDGFVSNYPDGYTLTSHGITAKIKVESEGFFKDKRVTICDYPVKFVARVYDHIDREDTAHFEVKLPKDGWREVSIKLRDITDQKGQKVSSVLGSVGCIISSEMQKHVGVFMSAYLKAVIAAAAASKSYSQLGWSDDGQQFILPTKVVKSDGTIETASVSAKVNAVSKIICKSGTFEEWLKVIDIYARNGYEAYAFGHAIAYGSLLMKFTDYDGALVVLRGDSGSGKSTVLRTINSVFGDPKKLMLQERDSEVAKFVQIATMRNISPCYDEASNIDPKELSDLCYGISQGRDKRRGAHSGGIRDDELTWCCIMAVTSNPSLYEILGALKTDASAESMRIFEYFIGKQMHQMGKAESEELFEPLANNYGHAGEVFVSWMMQNQDKCRERVKYWLKRFDVAAEVPTQERYWSAVVGATLAGAEMAKDLGLNKFDIENLLAFAVSQARTARSTVSENKRTGHALLVDFMNQSIRSSIVLKGGQTEKSAMWVSQEPTNGLNVRIELDKNRAYISISAIKKWVIESGGDYSAMRKDLLQKKVILNDKIDKVLSMGSESLRSGQVACWLVDLSHKEMSGLPTMQVVKMDKQPVEKVLASEKPF